MGWGKLACRSTKAAISLKRVKIEEKLLWRAYRRLKFWVGIANPQSRERGNVESRGWYGTIPDSLRSPFPWIEDSQSLPKTSIAIFSGTDKITNFKFCTRIHRIDRNKSPLKISVKVAVGVLRESRKFPGRIARSSLR